MPGQSTHPPPGALELAGDRCTRIAEGASDDVNAIGRRRRIPLAAGESTTGPGTPVRSVMEPPRSMAQCGVGGLSASRPGAPTAGPSACIKPASRRARSNSASAELRSPSRCASISRPRYERDHRMRGEVGLDHCRERRPLERHAQCVGGKGAPGCDARRHLGGQPGRRRGPGDHLGEDGDVARVEILLEDRLRRIDELTHPVSAVDSRLIVHSCRVSLTSSSAASRRLATDPKW